MAKLRYLPNTLRSRAFWFVDWLKGSKVKKEFRDVNRILSTNGSVQTIEEIDKALNALLDHAILTTPFYSSCKKAESIEAFPVIDKNIIRDNFDDFLSTTHSKDLLIPVVTSGSTGTPFKVYQTIEKRSRNTADTLYFAGKAGFEIGDHLVYLKIWAKEKMGSRFHYWLQNMTPLDVLHLRDDEISAMINMMEKQKHSYGILGYVSALEAVCKYLDNSRKTKVNAEVKSIITMSESLNSYVTDKMEEYFGCKVFSRYSNLENGIIAQQVEGSEGRFLINVASYFVEIFERDNDNTVSEGEKGRIVVTDLYNFGMPLIRYDTGDIGSMITDDDGTKYLSEIDGRKLDVIWNTRGEIVSSYIVYKNMWQYTEIKQYQLIQKAEGTYVLKVNISNKFEREEQLKNEFTSYLGADADFSVKYVDEIPLLASGKRRKIVNELIK